MKGNTVFPNIEFCLANGALQPADVERLTNTLVRHPRVQFLAGEFGVALDQMAGFALDAGIAFMRARLGTPEAGPFFSPSPVADAGWDQMADNVAERGFYEGFCERLCKLAGVVPRVLEHHPFSEAERQHVLHASAVRAVVASMDRLGIHYVAKHWPLDASGTCGDPAGSDPPPTGSCRVKMRVLTTV